MTDELRQYYSLETAPTGSDALSPLEELNILNGRLCFVLGIPLNALLVWLILRHSSAELRVYRKVLLQAAINDSLFLLATLMVQNVSGPL